MMKTTWLHAAAAHCNAGSIRWLVAACVALTFLTGCPSVPRSGQLAKPVFSVLEIPSATGGWTTYSSSPPMEVLPTRGRVMKLWFSAPIGSTFSLGLREPDGTFTPLPQTSAPASVASELGYFQVLNVNASVTPPLYTVHLRAPVAMMDPANFNVEVVNKSLRSDVTDSDPLVVLLAQRKVFTVTVSVTGNGHVTSNPPGIECGTTAQGRPMTQCSHDFGRGQITLNPGINDSSTTRFDGWSGNCQGTQPCTFTLNGMAPVIAAATFRARTATVPPGASCQAAPLLPGLRWVDIPQCATGTIDTTLPATTAATCDAAGFFCCKAGASNPASARCGAPNTEFPPDCRHLAPRGTLRQPGGCYEVDSGP